MRTRAREGGRAPSSAAHRCGRGVEVDPPRHSASPPRRRPTGKRHLGSQLWTVAAKARRRRAVAQSACWLVRRFPPVLSVAAVGGWLAAAGVPPRFPPFFDSFLRAMGLAVIHGGLGRIRFPHHWREREIVEERVCGRCWRGASAEGSRRHRRRAPRPTPAGLPYWGRSKPPFCLSKVCSPRPRRASSASQSTSGRPPGWERRLRPRAAAAGALGGPRPRAPAIGGDTRYLSARARRAICARTAPSARLEAFWATWLT